MTGGASGETVEDEEPAAAVDAASERLVELARRLRQAHLRTAPAEGERDPAESARRRLADLVEGVETCLLSGLPPPVEGEIELQLEALEQLFEASGDPRTGKVIGGIRESLVRSRGGAPADEPPPPRRFDPPREGMVRRSEPPVWGALRRAVQEFGEDPWERLDAAPRRRTWWLGAAAMAALAVIVVLVVRPQGWGSGDVPPAAPPAVEAVEQGRVPGGPEPTFQPEVLDLVEEAEAYEVQLELVKLEAEAGWRAIRSANLDQGVARLAAAATLDRHHRLVAELGRGVVRALVEAADGGANYGRWEEASERLAQARAVAEGLSLELAAVEAAEQRLAATRRFTYVLPEDHGGIRAAVGREVRITVIGAPPLDGVLRAFHDDVLSLEVDSGVPGGEVAFTTQLSLTRVRELRVFTDR